MGMPAIYILRLHKKLSSLTNHILSGKFIRPLELGPIFAFSYSNRVTHNFIFNIVSMLHPKQRCSYVHESGPQQLKGGKETSVCLCRSPLAIAVSWKLENFGTFPPESKGTSECEYLISILVYSQSELYIFDPAMFYWRTDPTGAITLLFPVWVQLFRCFYYTQD